MAKKARPKDKGQSLKVNRPDEILSAEEVAGLLKCSLSFVYRLRDGGKLAARYKIGDGQKGWRWKRADVESFITAHEIPGSVDEISLPDFKPVLLTKTGL